MDSGYRNCPHSTPRCQLQEVLFPSTTLLFSILIDKAGFEAYLLTWQVFVSRVREWRA
jgi:hypothetical protein